MPDPAPAQLARLVHLIAWMSQRDTGASVSYAAAARHLGVSRATIRDDLDALARLGERYRPWLASLSVAYTARGFVLGSRGPFRRPFRLTPDEALALVAGLAGRRAPAGDPRAPDRGAAGVVVRDRMVRGSAGVPALPGRPGARGEPPRRPVRAAPRVPAAHARRPRVPRRRRRARDGGVQPRHRPLAAGTLPERPRRARRAIPGDVPGGRPRVVRARSAPVRGRGRGARAGGPAGGGASGRGVAGYLRSRGRESWRSRASRRTVARVSCRQ